MRDEPEIDTSPGKSPHERFTELAKKIIAVPKEEIDAREAKWQKRKRIKPGPKKRRR
jgi:hypothetical protein